MSRPPLRPTVLLVEDSEDDAYFFRCTLAKCGLSCDLALAIDGREAIRHLEEARVAGRLPDLVFLDLKIPILSGFQVLAWIREQHFDPPLDVAVLSGSEHDRDIQRAHELGASGYFVKPLSPEQLQGRLARWLERPREPGQPGETAVPAGAGRNDTA